LILGNGKARFFCEPGLYLSCCRLIVYLRPESFLLDALGLGRERERMSIMRKTDKIKGTNFGETHRRRSSLLILAVFVFAGASDAF